MIRIILIGAASGLIAALVVIGVFRLIGMPASPALVAAIAGAVAATAVVGSIPRSMAGADADSGESPRGS